MAEGAGLIGILTAVVPALERLGRPFALVGGLAYSAWVEPRATVDIDLLMVLDVIPSAALLETLQPLFDSIVPHPAAMTFQQADIWRVVGIRGSEEIILDFVLATTEFHRAVLARRRLIPLAGVSVPLATPEDLILLKALAGRPRDLLDIARIRECLGAGLDENYLNSWSARLSLALP